MRTLTSRVTFTHPFTLPGFDRPHPAGSFEVSTDQEPLDSMLEGWRRVATSIRLVDRGQAQAWPVEPVDLEAALSRDASQSVAGALS